MFLKSELTPEELAYARERGLLRRAGESYAGGNRMTLADMERLVHEGKAMKATADAATAQARREQAEAEAAIAREKAEKERAVRLQAEAALKEELWSRFSYSRELFEARYDDLVRDHIRDEMRSQEDIVARKRREGQGL